MSFSQAGSNRPEWFKVASAQGGQGVDTPAGVPGGDSDIQERQRQGAASQAGPPGLSRLLSSEERREVARAAGRPNTAAAALRDVVTDLDLMLLQAAKHVRDSGGKRSRRKFRKAVPQLVTAAELAELPLGEVAEFLGVSAQVVDELLPRLVEVGGIGPDDRAAVLQGIEDLRDQLQQVQIGVDHSLLDRLIGVILRFTLLIGIAIAATPLGALAVGDPVMNEAIKTGVIALVALALQQFADLVAAARDRDADQTLAAEAHAALLAELTAAASLADVPAYDGEHAVLRFRLELRCARARVAVLPLTWPEKEQYWLELDQVLRSLHNAEFTDFDVQRRVLRELTPSDGQRAGTAENS
jgi:hypothetical protein